MPRRGAALPVTLLTCLALLACDPPPGAPAADYVQSIEEHRRDRERRLQSEDGWLTLVGLFWLDEGEHAFGSDPQNPIVFPPGSSPPVAGRLIYDGTDVTLVAEDGAGLTVNGEPVTRRVLADDTQDPTDIVELGRLRFSVIRRGSSRGVRVKDPESPVRTGFGGLRYFPIDPAFRVRGRFSAHAEPRPYAVPTVLGTPSDMLVPGVVEFKLGGKQHKLLPLVNGPEDTEFFFIIKDLTSGKDTYPAGRYLYADLEDGEVEIDFNKAYNPPCAFTPYATCPLPPRENWLDIGIEAGEMDYGDHARAGD